MTAGQYEAHRAHRKLYHELLEWGASPQSINQQELEMFLGCVYEGLIGARAIRAAHHEAYLAWALSELRDHIGAFNSLLGAPGAWGSTASGLSGKKQ
jgi:hypothetical protein